MRLLIFALLLTGAWSQMQNAKKTKATLNGLVLGVYDDRTLTAEGQSYDSTVAGALSTLITNAPSVVSQGTARLYFNLDAIYDSVAVVGLGSKTAGYDENEKMDLKLENIRAAAAAGVRSLRSYGETSALVDSLGDATAAAEGATLAIFSYDELKTSKTPIITIAPYLSANQVAWDRGVILAEGQNLVRELQEIPANILTPTEFGNRVQTLFAGIPEATVFIHDKAWAEAQGMNSFLSVAKGSAQPPIFVEVHFNNSDIVDEAPVILIGKGINFDSGGISLKEPDGMGEMRADMTGAAAAVVAVYTLARLGEKVNAIALAPMTENMPSGESSRPSDVVRAKNGKTIQIDDTDAEGRLVLADALSYASELFRPAVIIDMATLTGSVYRALGSAAIGVFSTSDLVWTSLYTASIQTGDRVWRLPLYKNYGDQMKVSQLADLNNVNTVSSRGGASTAAAFLREFVTITNWAHLDIAGVMTNSGEVPYLGSGMAGRPFRTIVEFVPVFLAGFR